MSWLKSFLISLEWRVISTLTDISIIYMITKRIDLSLKIGLITGLAKILVFTIWNKKRKSV